MRSSFLSFTALLAAAWVVGSCRRAAANVEDEAPPAASVLKDAEGSKFKVEHPERFPLATAVARSGRAELLLTGAVVPDASRSIPVTSLVAGRVVALHARLGDEVKKGQLLLSMRSDDVVSAYSDYQKSVADELLTKTQYERAKDLHEHGAMATSDLEVAENAENKAKVDVEANKHHLDLFGGTADHSDGMVDIRAPVSGVITDQQVTNAAGVQGLGSAAFTISDLSKVWVVCDVYESDLAKMKIGDSAEVRLSAYPDQSFEGKLSNIGAVLDPNLRTAKVRIEVKNPGLMRVGMFVTAIFRAQAAVTYTTVPASAVMRLHDQDWVYVQTKDQQFERQAVIAGATLPGGQQEIKSGLSPGQSVVRDALVLDRALEL